MWKNARCLTVFVKMEEFAKKDWVTIIATVHWDTLGKIAIKVQWSFILCIKEGLEYQTMNKIVSNESEKKIHYHNQKNET